MTHWIFRFNKSKQLTLSATGSAFKPDFQLPYNWVNYQKDQSKPPIQHPTHHVTFEKERWSLFSLTHRLWVTNVSSRNNYFIGIIKMKKNKNKTSWFEHTITFNWSHLCLWKKTCKHAMEERFGICQRRTLFFPRRLT